MSDSSEDEDLSRFKEAVDVSFTKLINESRGIVSPEKDTPKSKSERYLETASHYNDVKVPEEMQKRIGAKLSAVINKNLEFVEIEQNGSKKHKIKGGVKLFTSSQDFLSPEEPKDTYTEDHNRHSKKIGKRRRHIIEPDNKKESDKISSVVVTGEYILSKEETKYWKSRRKEKVFNYKAKGKSNILIAI